MLHSIKKVFSVPSAMMDMAEQCTPLVTSVSNVHKLDTLSVCGALPQHIIHSVSSILFMHYFYYTMAFITVMVITK